MIVILFGILAVYAVLFLAGAYLKILWLISRYGGFLVTAAVGGLVAHRHHQVGLVIVASAAASALVYWAMLRGVRMIMGASEGERPVLCWVLRGVEFVLVGFVPFLIGAGFALHVPPAMLTPTERQVVIGISGFLMAVLVYHQHVRAVDGREGRATDPVSGPADGASRLGSNFPSTNTVRRPRLPHPYLPES